MERKKKYYYLSLDSCVWVWVGIIITIFSLILGWPTEGDNWKWIISIVLFLLGIAAIIIPPIVSNNREIKKAYPDGLLEEAISDAIEASKQKKDRVWYVKKYEHYLREITQADKLNPIDLNIDDPKFDNLFTLKGALSVTNAPLAAWKDPEYSWFLIANYIATLNKRYQSGQKNMFQLKNRGDNEFIEYIKKGEVYLKKIAEGNFDYNTNIRFYILSKDEIENNKAMLEQMIAGHELCGIYLFIIDTAVFSEKNDQNVGINTLYDNLLTSSNISNDVFDVMIYKSEQNAMMVKYPSEGVLKERGYDDIKGICEPFIKALATKLLSDSYKIYPKEGKTKIDMGTVQIDLNKDYTFVNV